MTFDRSISENRVATKKDGVSSKRALDWIGPGRETPMLPFFSGKRKDLIPNGLAIR